MTEKMLDLLNRVQYLPLAGGRGGGELDGTQGNPPSQIVGVIKKPEKFQLNQNSSWQSVRCFS